MPVLYERTVTGNRVRYVEHITPRFEIPKIEKPTAADIFGLQDIIALSVTIGTSVLIVFERQLPVHARYRRKLEKLKEAIASFREGQPPISPDAVEYWRNVWDRTMLQIDLELNGGSDEMPMRVRDGSKR